MVYLNTLKFGSSRLVRASLLLSQYKFKVYKFKVLHTPGRTNHVADALSRVSELQPDALTAYQQSRHCANDQIDLSLEDNVDTDLSANHSVNIGIQCDLIDCNSSIVFQKSESCAKQIDGAADRQRHVDMERPADSARQSPASPGRQEIEPSHIRSVTGATVKSCDRTAKQGDSAQQRADTNNNNTQTCSSPAHAASHADSRTDHADNTLHAHSHLLQRVRTDQHADLAVGLTDSDAQRKTAILSRCTANVSEGTRTVHMTDKQCPLAEVNDAQADNIATTRTSVDQCIARRSTTRRWCPACT